MRRAFLALALLLAAALLQAQPAKPLRILFVGNSLTSHGDIPGRLAKLARTMQKPAHIEAVTFDGFSLEDHWKDGRAAEAIRNGWDIVVLQQGGSAQDSGRELTEYSQRFARVIRAAGGRPALLMVWPSQDRPRDFEAVIAAYRSAAQEVRGLIVPAGEAWLRALGQDKRLRLYSDPVHPAALGTDLAVLTLYFSFFPAGPREFDESYVARIATALQLPPERRDLLVDAATRAIDEPMPFK